MAATNKNKRKRDPLSPTKDNSRRTTRRTTRRTRNTNDAESKNNTATKAPPKAASSAPAVAKSVKNTLPPIQTDIAATVDRSLRDKMGHSNQPPSDIRTNESYHPAMVKIGIAIIKFQEHYINDLLPHIKTNDGKEVILNLPSIPWGLPPDKSSSSISLNYLTSEEGRGLKGLSCFTAERSDGSLRCKCLELIRLLATDESYFQAVIWDQNPLAIPHESTLEEYIGIEMAREVMNAFKQVIDAIFENVEKLAICAQSASKAFSLSMYGNETSLVKIFEDCKDPRSKLLRQKVLSISGTSYECMGHPCSLLHKNKAAHFEAKARKADEYGTLLRHLRNPSADPCNMLLSFFDENSVHFKLLQAAAIQACLNGGKECGRMHSKGKQVAEDLIARGLAKNKWEASKILQKYITDEVKENKASNIQKKYSSCCELNLASEIAYTLESTELCTSKHDASKSEEMIETLIELGDFTREKASSIARRYESSFEPGLALASEIASSLVNSNKFSSKHEASKSKEMIQALVDQGDFTREKASSIARRYQPLLDPESRRKAVITIQDSTWARHYKEMNSMWTESDPSVKVAVEVDQGVKHVLYVQKTKAPALYQYVQYLLSLPKEDSRYITATAEFNIHLQREAGAVLRKRRAEKTR